MFQCTLSLKAVLSELNWWQHTFVYKSPFQVCLVEAPWPTKPKNIILSLAGKMNCQRLMTDICIVIQIVSLAMSIRYRPINNKTTRWLRFFSSTAVETSSWIYAPISSERTALGHKLRTVSGRTSIMFCSLYRILFASETSLHLFIYFHLQHWAQRFSVGSLMPTCWAIWPKSYIHLVFNVTAYEAICNLSVWGFQWHSVPVILAVLYIAKWYFILNRCLLHFLVLVIYL